MKKFAQFVKSGRLRKAALTLCLVAVSGLAHAASRYLVANDDHAAPLINGVTFYPVDSSGILASPQRVNTRTYGIGGGFFGANRISVLNTASQQCVFASQALEAEIVGIDVNTLTVQSSTSGSLADAGSSNGIGLAMTPTVQYLYASFTDSNTIATFQVQPGCALTFVNDVAVAGLAGGIINGMAVHGKMMIATYTDGTIESFDLSAGTPRPHGDKQYSTATLASMDATYPNSIDITSNGHFAIFGDTSTSQVVEVSDISSGKLTPTVVYSSRTAISSSNVMLSPDETILYVVNTQGAHVTAMFFDKATGKLSPGCISNRLRGQSADWSYLAGLSLISPSGNGGGVYVAEYGGPSGIAMVALTSSGGKCSLQEVKQSPFSEPNSQGLLSIGSFPPRSF